MRRRKVRLRSMNLLFCLALVSCMAIMSACSHEDAEIVTGYGVIHEDGRLLLVAPIHPDDPEGRRDAVWIGNLGSKHVGGLLRVTLKDVADSYPAQSSARKTVQVKQLKGEKEILRLCLDYAKEKWQDQAPVINSVHYSEERSVWEVETGSLLEDRTMVLQVDQNKNIIEVAA